MLGGSDDQGQKAKRSKEFCEAALAGKQDGEEAGKALAETKQDAPKFNLSHPGQKLELLLAAEGDTPGTKTAKSAVQHVCHDECEDLVTEMKNQAEMLFTSTSHLWVAPFSETCAQIVVQKVESHILTCCAQACGWNEKACTYWPFMSEGDQEDWFAECCAEEQIMRFSDRDRMCKSVLPPSKADKLFAEDVGAELGQDETWVWTKEGAKKDAGFAAGAAEGEQVMGYFLDWWGISVQEGKRQGLWKVGEVKPTKSFLQLGNGCDEGGNYLKCDKQMFDKKLKSCKEADGWQWMSKSHHEEFVKNCKIESHNNLQNITACKNKAAAESIISWIVVKATSGKDHKSECRVLSGSECRFNKRPYRTQLKAMSEVEDWFEVALIRL